MNFCLMISIGFIVLSHIAAYAELRGISPYLAALTSSVFGVSNAFGRPGIYLLSRKFGIERTMLLVFASQAIFMFLIPYSGNTALFALIAFAGIMYGANLSLFPALIAEYFGKANLGANYGLIFTAVAAAALLGPLSGSIIFDVLGGYDRAFLLAAIMAGVALFLGFFLRKPSVGDY
jgi:MFS family permease